MDYNQFPEYRFIQHVYKGKEATRSHVPYIQHIDEGLVILECIGADMLTRRAYCLHGALQSDEDLHEYFYQLPDTCHPKAVALAMEYRRVANSYLSTHHFEHIDIGPLFEVGQMLVADKVQNRKDFEIYHQNTHPRSQELSVYFHKWQEQLGISEERYQELKRLIEQEIHHR